MLLKKLEINGLFGIFNHEVKLFDNGISIIIGENGVGKTYILEAINNLFNLKFGFFGNLEFDYMIFEFNDGVRWEIRTEEVEEDNLHFYITEYKKKKKLNELDVSLKSLDSPYSSQMRLRRTAEQLSKIISSVEKITPMKYYDHATKSLLRPDELIDEYSDFMMFDLFEESDDQKNDKSWLEERAIANKTHFIETQRIYKFMSNEDAGYSETIMQYARELSGNISIVENKYSQESSKLDESFPYRLISKIREENDTGKENTNKIEELSESLLELDERRGELKNLGLLLNEDSKKINKQDIKLAKEAIELYVEDSNKKFDVYEDLQNKISLLLSIINKRFNNKKLKIHKEKGFIFEQISTNDNNKKEIPIKRLSSGEKNEFILFYDLLFKSNDKNLILIDEPEISLHISWQNLFIEDIKSIHKLNNINVLLATHSPDIIGGNWEITNNLGKG